MYLCVYAFLFTPIEYIKDVTKSTINQYEEHKNLHTAHIYTWFTNSVLAMFMDKGRTNIIRENVLEYNTEPLGREFIYALRVKIVNNYIYSITNSRHFNKR